MIDYGNIAESIKFYERQGYTRVESPWMVSSAVSDITRPPEGVDYHIKDSRSQKVLVASGEQSFLYMYLKGFLPQGKFQTTTPCFRNEPFDAFHTKYFVKTELINTVSVTQDNLEIMVNTALRHFRNLVPSQLESQVQYVPTQEGYDIELAGVELGSYGIRKCEFLEWIYGTAIAEPRFSQAVKAALK